MSVEVGSAENEAVIRMGIGGEFKLSKGKADADGNLIPGTMQDVTDWFSNHVLDTGLDMIGTSAPDNLASGYLRGAQLGSGNTPPEDEDTALVNRLGSSVTRLQQSQSKNLSTLPYYFEILMVYRFAAGVATGTIAECGIVGAINDLSGGAMNPSAPLFARALTVDPSGDPTTVTKLPDEIVDLHYRLRYYINTEDVTGSIEIGGDDYDYTLRPLRMEVNQAGVNDFGWGFQALQTNGANSSIYARTSAGAGPNRIYTGATADLAPLTGGDPAGTSVPGNTFNISNPEYVTGSHELEHRISCGLGSAGTGFNDPNGIGVIVFGTGISNWQMKLEPNLVKTSDDLFNISIFHTWERYTP